MTERVKNWLQYYNTRAYRALRDNRDVKEEKKVTSKRRLAIFSELVIKEKPLFYGEDPFGFNRYQAKHPYDCSGGNITIDYEEFLKTGLQGLEKRIDACYDGANAEAKDFYDDARAYLVAVRKLVQTYREAAKNEGKTQLYEALQVIPENGAEDYYQALVALKFLQYTLRLNGNQHVGLGRFDVYMKPYFDQSIQKGATKAELAELTEMFFIALNFDGDIYFGLQQGDNGQSMMLGGCDKRGEQVWNELSEICLQASEDLQLIDPKINVRVNKNTPLSFYERCTRLTKQGLGFPQYSNDDVVIPGLVALGYDLEDARNYTVAACWEFIIPGCGADTPNITTMNFPLVIEHATEKYLPSAQTFAEFLAGVKAELEEESKRQIAYGNEQVWSSDVLMSLLIRPCIERGKKMYEGAKYRNFGMHGAGISNAADALEAIERAVFVDKIVSAKELLTALKVDFVGYEDLQKQLLAYPKMGNNEDSVDNKAAFLMEHFAAFVNGKPNRYGGVYRAGTGSAMEYILSAAKVGATADGKKAGAPFGSSFSPAITTRFNGPLSAIQSFTKFDMKKVINGGPFTFEVHDTVFRNEEGEQKLAMLVKAFMDRGGHQMQVNAINRDTLLDAQKHPEKYPNLIVRVWGWSGYFNELELPYQNHVISRFEFMV